jgi:hypothetical protein
VLVVLICGVLAICVAFLLAGSTGLLNRAQRGVSCKCEQLQCSDMVAVVRESGQVEAYAPSGAPRLDGQNE